MTRCSLLALLWLLCSLTPALAQADIIYTGTAQPSIRTVSIHGARRGSTVTLVADGLNLGGTSGAIFNAPGFASRVLAFAEQLREKPQPVPLTTVIADKATKDRVTLEITIAADVAPGIYEYRLITPLGTTNERRFAVTGFAETPERGGNNSGETAQMISLPATITGALGRNGEADYFRFKARAGQQIVFRVAAAPFGSALDSVITLLDSQGNALAANDDHNGQPDSLLGYTFSQDGEYLLRLTDAESRGMADAYDYRLDVGEFSWVTHIFPLGVREGSQSTVQLHGFNLKAGQQINAPAAPARELWIRGAGTAGESINRLKLDVGRWPELSEQGSNDSVSAAQKVQIPATINGRIFSGDAGGKPADYYRFSARKGQKLILAVAAQQLGSPLDSVLEILDVAGRPVPRAVLRSELATETTLNDRDSASAGLRLLSWNGMNPGDYLLVGSELLRIDRLPYFPDDDTVMRNFNGMRYGFLDTTPEARAMGTAVYKVSLHPPGTTFPANGLPVVTLYYRNDDAGPLYGLSGMKDSRLHFTAPADGDYVVRISDVRGQGGEDFAYRLSLSEPQPDFLLAIDPENPNVPRGGARDIRVTATRLDGFDGEIEVQLLDLPAGFTATTATIPAGQHVSQINLSASSEAGGSFILRARGTAASEGRRLMRETSPDQRLSLVSVAPPPEVVPSCDERVTVAPGEEAYINIAIRRQAGFAGRVPFEVVGLPPGVTLRDLGLNGIMITEGETTTRFRIEVQPWVRPLEQQIFIVGRIETTGLQPQRFPAAPLTLMIRSRETVNTGPHR